jgi:zinc transport system permease protein
MFAFDFMRNAFLVSLFISVLCPSIGIFLVLRRYSMIGDTLSHASLAGITIGLLMNQNPVVGAFVFTSLSGALIEFLRGYFKKNTDLILSIVLALCVGTAITLISSGRLHTNAESFLFGSVLTVTVFDTVTVLVLSVISVLTLLLLYHQLVYIAYDEEAAKVAGVKVRLLNYIFSVLVASAISVTIRIVGVLVISSMIALPVASALQLEKGFKTTLVFSVLFSIADIMLGLVLSYFLGVAAGGFTALVSVFVLIVVIVVKKCVKIRATAEIMR